MGKNGSKNKISLDLLETLHTSQFEDTEYKFGINIFLRFYIQKSIFGQKILLKICYTITYIFDHTIFYSKPKFGLNLLENLHTSQFEGVKINMTAIY